MTWKMRGVCGDDDILSSLHRIIAMTTTLLLKPRRAWSVEISLCDSLFDGHQGRLRGVVTEWAVQWCGVGVGVQQKIKVSASLELG